MTTTTSSEQQPNRVLKDSDLTADTRLLVTVAGRSYPASLPEDLIPRYVQQMYAYALEERDAEIELALLDRYPEVTKFHLCIWLEELPSHGEMEDVIDNSFIWDYSPEGHAFWSDYSRLLNRRANEDHYDDDYRDEDGEEENTTVGTEGFL